jgi:IstB-like ATP binding protein
MPALGDLYHGRVPAGALYVGRAAPAGSTTTAPAPTNATSLDITVSRPGLTRAPGAQHAGRLLGAVRHRQQLDRPPERRPPLRDGRLEPPFGRWGETFSDVVAAAMIDRLVHHAEVLTLKPRYASTTSVPPRCPDSLPSR